MPASYVQRLCLRKFHGNFILLSSPPFFLASAMCIVHNNLLSATQVFILVGRRKARQFTTVALCFCNLLWRNTLNMDYSTPPNHAAFDKLSLNAQQVTQEALRLHFLVKEQGTFHTRLMLILKHLGILSEYQNCLSSFFFFFFSLNAFEI